MTHTRPFRRRLGRLAKLAILVAGLSLVAAPLALAGTEHPEGVPPAETPPEGVPVGSEGTAPPEGVTPGPPAGVQQGTPEGLAPTYSGTENPGVAHRLTAGEAHALGREQCQEWKTNFRDNKSQFGRCIADVAKALHGAAAPGRACANLNRKPEEGEHRSDFSACVAAAAQALREAHES